MFPSLLLCANISFVHEVRNMPLRKFRGRLHTSMAKGSTSIRTALRHELQDQFVRVFTDKGFRCAPLPIGAGSTDARSSFPLGHLERMRGGELELIDIQFDKYRRPRFVINFGVIPEEGISTPWGHHVERDAATASDAPEACRLYSSSFGMRWFALGIFSSKSSKSVKRLVDKAMELSPEIDQWFLSRTVGKHMRVLTGHSFATADGWQNQSSADLQD